MAGRGEASPEGIVQAEYSGDATDAISTFFGGDNKSLVLSAALFEADSNYPEYEQILQKAEDLVGQIDAADLVALVKGGTVHPTVLVRLFEKYVKEAKYENNFKKLAEALVELKYLDYDLGNELKIESKPSVAYPSMMKFKSLLQNKTIESLIDKSNIHISIIQEFLRAAIKGDIIVSQDLQNKAKEMLAKLPDRDTLTEIEIIVMEVKDYKGLQSLIESEMVDAHQLKMLAISYQDGRRKDPGGCFTKISQALKFK